MSNRVWIRAAVVALLLVVFSAGATAQTSNKVVVIPLGDDASSGPLSVVTWGTPTSCFPPSLPSATSGAVVFVQFNHDVEEAVSIYPGSAAEALDDGLFIISPNEDLDGVVNQLDFDVSQFAQEKGVTIDFSGNTMTISWNPSAGLSIIDDDDPIIGVGYAGLGNVQVQQVGSPSSAQSLSSWLSMSSIACMP